MRWRKMNERIGRRETILSPRNISLLDSMQREMQKKRKSTAKLKCVWIKTYLRELTKKKSTYLREWRRAEQNKYPHQTWCFKLNRGDDKKKKNFHVLRLEGQKVPLSGVPLASDKNNLSKMDGHQLRTYNSSMQKMRYETIYSL